MAIVLGWAGAAVVAFHLAFLVPAGGSLIGVFLFGLLQLTRLATGRQAFYAGLATGVLCYAPHLVFFWTIFGAVAAALWLVLAFWIGLFVLLARATRRQFGLRVAALLVPCVWLGLEYFRSELYYLRFSWLTAGFAFAGIASPVGLAALGVYGLGFLLMALAAVVWVCPGRSALWTGLGLLLAVSALGRLPLPPRTAEDTGGRRVKIAGMQMEFPGPVEILTALDELARAHPDAELLFLSEYTFDGPIPDRVRAWCQSRGKHLLAGGKDLLPEGQYYNTAFVIDPRGEIVFRQPKSVPIQFFNDGLPAPAQRTWSSPWGRIGIPTCYDLSYTRVVDAFVRDGAQALLVPTMDTVVWGRYQHELHARVAPVRAAEHGVPIFRLASSGISQVVNRQGRVLATAPFPGDRAMIAGELALAGPGRLPVDRWLGPAGVAVVVLLIPALFIASRLNRSALP